MGKKAARKTVGKSQKSRKPRASAPSSVVSGNSKIGGIDGYEVRNSLETLSRADQIKNDPKMMKAVGIEAKRQSNALSKFTKG